MKNAKHWSEVEEYVADPAEYLSSDNEYRNCFAKKLTADLEHIKSMLLTAPSFILAVKAAIPKTELRVMLSPLQKKRLDNGSLKLLTTKDGKILAELWNPKTKQFAGHLELEKVQLNPDIMNALTNYAMQMQLAQITEQLQEIQKTVKEILRGQENDRLAEAYACRQNLLTVVMISDSALKYQSLIHIAQSSETARQKLMLSQKETLAFIENQPDDLIGKIVKGSSPAKIEDAMNKLYIGLDAINAVSMAEAVAYQEMDEPEAAVESLRVYSEYLLSSYARPHMVELLDLNTGRTDSYWSNILSNIETQISSIPNHDGIKLLKGES